MVEVHGSRSRDYFPPTSDESDDLETPLDVWRRLHPRADSPRDEVDASTPDNRYPSKVVTNLKRRNRRRLNSRDIIQESSSDDDFVVKRKLGSKTAKNSKNKSRLPSDRSKASKAPSVDFDDVAVIDDYDSPTNYDLTVNKRKSKSSRNLKARTLPPTRRSARIKKRQRKKPIEFFDDSQNCVAASTTTDEQPPHFEPNENLNDSQKTILLSTPDINAFEIDDEIPESPQRPLAEIAETSSNKLDNSSLITDIDESENMSVIFQPEEEKTEASDIDNRSTDFDDSFQNSAISSSKSRHVDKTNTEESTALDDIFFKPSSKKPPPGRLQKKVSAAESTIDANTQESTCSSLLEDDSLWVTR